MRSVKRERTDLFTSQYEVTDLGTLFSNGETLTTVTSSTENPRSYNNMMKRFMYRFGVYLQRYILPLIVIVGLFGNSVSFIVSMQRHNRKMSFCVYMTYLAIIDNGALILFFNFWCHTDLFFTYFTEFMCQIQLWFFSFFTVSSCYIVVLMTLDRWLAVTFPFKARYWCTSKKAHISCIIVISILGLYNVHYAYFAGPSANHHVCLGYGRPSRFNLLLAWLNFSINSFIPFSVLISVNTAIIYKVRRGRKFFIDKLKAETSDGVGDPPSNARDKSTKHLSSAKRLTASKALSKSTKTDKNSYKEKENQLVKTLLLVSFTLLVLTLPFYIRNIAYTFYDRNASLESFITYNFFFHITSKIYCLNNAVNFFLYILGGNKFREDVKNLFCFKTLSKSTTSEATQLSTIA